MVEQRRGGFIPAVVRGRRVALPVLALARRSSAALLSWTRIAEEGPCDRDPIIVTLLACLVALLALPSAALAWSNGDDGGNGFGTHDWILREATRLAAERNAGWVILKVAEPKTDDPDTVFHDT